MNNNDERREKCGSLHERCRLETVAVVGSMMMMMMIIMMKMTTTRFLGGEIILINVCL